MAERRRPSTNVLLARKVRELERRVRALETDRALTYAADSEVLGMDENPHRERIWFSPGCEKAEERQLSLKISPCAV